MVAGARDGFEVACAWRIPSELDGITVVEALMVSCLLSAGYCLLSAVYYLLSDICSLISTV
jgi:hypothetical protein